jgi:Bacterial extracellular solute-binding proteins, family 3
MWIEAISAESLAPTAMPWRQSGMTLKDSGCFSRKRCSLPDSRRSPPRRLYRLRHRHGQPDRLSTRGEGQRQPDSLSADPQGRHRHLQPRQECRARESKDEPKLLAKINEIIAQAKASGEIGKLSEKWLKAPLPPGF